MDPYANRGTLTADNVVTDLGSKFGLLPPKGEPAKSQEQTAPAVVSRMDTKIIIGFVGAAAILLLLTRRK